MAQVKFGSAGITTREIDLSGPVAAQPVGVPAAVVGTSNKGRAFVPTTVATISDFEVKIGATDGEKFGPLAAEEWLKNSQSLTYVRVLGAGDGQKRTTVSDSAGKVTSAGFVVGEQQPSGSSGALGKNVYANSGGLPGRTYFIGAFMSESAGSTIFSDAGIQTSATAAPLIRGMLMAPSGVILKLSSSFGAASGAPSSTLVATEATVSGAAYGAVNIGSSKQQFVMLLNGHKGTDSRYPNVITASFDPTAPNYFANVLNTDPLKTQEAGHYLYSYWDVHPSLAVVTGTGLVAAASGAAGNGGIEACAFLTSGSNARNVGTSTAPNFENFEDRYRHATTPWIVSQKFGGKPKNLFKLHSLHDGKGISSSIKVSIENIAPSSDIESQYGSFDVVVRDWNDTDTNVRPLETFRSVNLDPASERYISKVIGDLNIYFDFDRAQNSQRIVVEGNYENVSNYIRVETDASVENGEIEPTALPMGYRGLPHFVTSGSAPLTSQNFGDLQSADILKRAVQIPVPFRKSLTEASGTRAQANPNLYWGIQFEKVESATLTNSTSAKNDSIKSFTKYYPDFMTVSQNVLETGSIGVADSAAVGILDVDRFNNNGFSLENIKVVTGSLGIADSQQWASAVYVRNGVITPDDTAKTRALSTSDLVQTNRRFAKFTTVLQGGWDGTNDFDKEESTLSDISVKADMSDSARGLANGPTVKAYLSAANIVKSKTDVEMQLLVVPGIKQPVVTDTLSEIARDRSDVLYIMDIVEYDNLGQEVTGSAQVPSVSNTALNFKSRSIDNSFAAAYYPEVVLTDPNTLTNVVAPASVAVLGAFSRNDKLAKPWFAAAGFNRGNLNSTQEAKVKLSKDNLDTLQDANINPLVAFPGAAQSTQAQGGVVVYGQKTLQASASALDRVNVRRLLIELKRLARDVAKTILFEPNVQATLSKFSSALNPKLARVQKQLGVEKYKVVIDTSTTTAADIENNTIKGQIIVQPYKSVEYVGIDFEVGNSIG